MSINLLKRLESSVYSFWLTIERIKMLIDSTIEMIDRYQSGNLVFDLTEITDSEDFDYGMIDGYINNGSKSAERSSKASIRVTKTTVEVFYHGSRVSICLCGNSLIKHCGHLSGHIVVISICIVLGYGKYPFLLKKSNSFLIFLLLV